MKALYRLTPDALLLWATTVLGSINYDTLLVRKNCRGRTCIVSESGSTESSSEAGPAVEHQNRVKVGNSAGQTGSDWPWTQVTTWNGLAQE